MIAPKYIAVAVMGAMPMLLAGARAEAFTARQSTAGGQGIYANPSGMPVNFVGNASTAQPGSDGARGANQPRDLEHHGRYFGGN